jgi:hypothetical protein
MSSEFLLWLAAGCAGGALALLLVLYRLLWNPQWGGSRVLKKPRFR